MFGNWGDEIVESRTWSSGVEIVTHVNWSHIARVRRALGVAGEEFSLRDFGQPSETKRRTQRPRVAWRRAIVRAA
jgi:hypothetical protein